MATKKFLSLEKLTEYDGLMKAFIDENDESTLSSAKAYTDEKMASIPSVDGYTKAEVDSALAGKADVDHNHDMSAFETKEDAQSKYDEIINAKADWNQNDEAAIDYIKNRTHYEYNGNPVEKTILDNQSITFGRAGLMYVYMGSLEMEPIKANQHYTLIINGEIIGSATAINEGNTIQVVLNEDGEGIYQYTEESIEIDILPSRSDSTTNTVTITTLEPQSILKQLDEKFIPDIIARKSYVDSNFALKSEIGNVDLSEYETKADAQLKVDEVKAYADTIVSGKANVSHTHNDIYYTESEVDNLLTSKADSTHNHDADYDAKGSADTALASAKSYTDTKTSGLASTSAVDTKISTHNTSTSAHNDIRNLISGLTTRLNTLANSDDTTLDQLSEIVAYIKSNKSLIDAITTSKVNVSDIVNNLTTSATNKPLSAAQGVAIKALIDALQEELDSHYHAISDVTGLQSALDGKAASSHGTHVSYATTAPKMDGTASAGSASTVARTDHVHPTDTSRASQVDLDALETVVEGKANATHTHAISDVTNLQSSLDAKQATVTGAATTITGSNLTVNRALISNSSGKVTVSAVTSTELGYLDGVTSAIQTQLNNKASSSHTHAISDVTNLQSTLDGKAGKKVDGQTTTLDGVSYVGGTNAEVFNDYEANVATGAYSHAEGCYNKATGDYSHAEGAATTASGYAGHTEGYQTKALGASSHAEGKNTAATGQTAHAEGNSSTMLPNTITTNSSVSDVETAWNSTKFTLARGTGSHAEGSNTLALSTDDHSEGYETVAKGGYSHAQGYKTVASGGRAHAEGQGSVASGNDSHAEGAYTIAAGDYQHVQGKYNVEDAAGKYAHIVGGGNTINSRSNINTLDWNGNVWFKGDVYIGGTSQDDGKKLLSGTVPIANGGTGATTAAGALVNLGITAGTSDLTAGSSSLATGAIYQVYS